MKKSRKGRNLYLIVAIMLSLSMPLMTLRPQKGNTIQDHTMSSEHVKGLKSSASVSELWNYSTGYYVSSSPALGDVDNDGKLEVVVGGDLN